MNAVVEKPITRDQVEALEAQIRQAPPAAITVKHHFSKGIYAREIFIPAGTVLTGKIHKTENLNIMSQGRMSVLIDGKIELVEAPFTVVSSPGTKRVAVAHTDVIWTTIHATDERDLSKIESEFVVDSEVEYLAFVESSKLLGSAQ